MARARRVRGIKPDKGLRRNARKVIAVRLEELVSWSYSLDDPALVRELHDMRIAAKRLRYALEIFSVCFPVKDVLHQLTGMQEDLGVIHDLDVANDVFLARLHAVDAAVERRAIEIMGRGSSVKERDTELRAWLLDQSRNETRIGLLGLIGDGTAERARRFELFRQTWNADALQAFQDNVSTAAGLERHIIPHAEH